MMRFASLCLIALLLRCSTVSGASYEGSLSSQFSGTDPAQPIAGVPFYANVMAGPCESLSIEPASATVVSQVGGVVTVRIPGVPDAACRYEFRPLKFLLPGLPPGSYRVDLVLYFIEQPGDFGEPAGYIGGRDVTVVLAPPAAVIPATSNAALLAAITLLMIAAWLGRPGR